MFSNVTMGHGLRSKPDAILKNRDTRSLWCKRMFFIKDIGAITTTFLDSTGAARLIQHGITTVEPTTSVFTLIGLGANNNKYIAYCFSK